MAVRSFQVGRWHSGGAGGGGGRGELLAPGGGGEVGRKERRLVTGNWRPRNMSSSLKGRLPQAERAPSRTETLVSFRPLPFLLQPPRSQCTHSSASQSGCWDHSMANKSAKSSLPVHGHSTSGGRFPGNERDLGGGGETTAFMCLCGFMGTSGGTSRTPDFMDPTGLLLCSY